LSLSFGARNQEGKEQGDLLSIFDDISGHGRLPFSFIHANVSSGYVWGYN